MKGGLGSMPLTLFVIVAGVVLYLYLRRANLGIDKHPGEAPGSATGSRLGALDKWATQHFLRLETSVGTPGDYTLLPQPGAKVDVPYMAGSATRAGFPTAVRQGEIHVTLPYEGE